MVAGEHDDGVVEELRVFEDLDELAHLVVDVRAVGKVSSTSALDVGVRHFFAPEVDDLQ